jgi:hypothetical protein
LEKGARSSCRGASGIGRTQGRFWPPFLHRELSPLRLAFNKEVNPRGRDPFFLETYEREVRLAATDLLLYHLAEEHEGDFLGADSENFKGNGNGASQ